MKQHHRLFFAVALVLLTISGCKQHRVDDAINHIQERFKAINSDKSLKKVTLDAEDFLEESPDNGAELNGYFKGDSLLKIHAWYGLSYCVLQYDYYLENGKPVFIFETEQDFPYDTATQTMNFNKLKPVFEGRYYINNNKIFKTKCKGKKGLGILPTEAYISNLIADMDDLKMKLKHPNKKASE